MRNINIKYYYYYYYYYYSFAVYFWTFASLNYKMKKGPFVLGHYFF